MSHQVLWTKLILERFIELAALTEEEEQIMRTRVAGWPRSKQAARLGMSMSKVDTIIRRLKLKYDNVARYDPILPKRKHSAEETFMD